MKMRMGFVSNSSSSSYVILGFKISPITPPAEGGFWKWHDDNRENKDKLERAILEETGEEVQVVNPWAEMSDNTPMNMGYVLGWEGAEYEVDEEDIARKVKFLRGLKEKIGRADPLARKSSIFITDGTQGYGE